MAINKEMTYHLNATDDISPKIVQIAKNTEQKLVKAFEKTAQVTTKLQEQNRGLTTSYTALDKASTGFMQGIGIQLAEITKLSLTFVGAWAGAKIITKTFPVIETGIHNISEASLKASFNADKAFSEFVKGEGILRKAQQTFFSLKSKGLDQLGKGLKTLKVGMAATRTQLEATILVSKAMAKATLGTGKAFLAAAKHTELLEKGLAGTITRAGIGAGVFSALGSSLLTSDGVMKKMAGVTLIALALALGGFVAVVNQALNAVGNLIIKIGDGLTKSSLKQIETFSKAEKTTFAFNHTIAAYSHSADEATSSIKNWTKFQEQLSSQTGTTAATMRTLIAETVSATKSMNLGDKEQKQLIRSTIDLSERAHRPAIDTLTALINAMNGAGQGVVALGLHVNDAAIEHSKLTQAQKENFKSADDATKAQLRYAVLMEQAGRAAGFASQNSDLYSKSIKLQKNAQKTLNAELGRGAAIINGQYVLGLAKATNAVTSFFKPILPGIGFLQALGGRILQVTGLLAKNLLTITLLTSSYKAFNVLLAKGFAGGAFGKEIPFINKSLIQMAKNLGATNLQLDSLKNVAKASMQILKTQSLNGVKALFGLNASAKLTAGTMGKQMVKGLGAMTAGLWNGVKAAAAFAVTPVGATITAIAVAAILLYKAFQKLEEETGIFSEIWADLSKSFQEASPAIEAIKQSLIVVGNVLAKGFGAAIKLTAAGLSGLVRTIYTVILGWQQLSTFLPGSLGASQAAIAKTEATIAKLDAATSKFAKGALSDFANLFSESASASEQAAHKISLYTKQLHLAASASSKMAEAAKKAFEFAADFTPKINLKNFQDQANKFKGDIAKLKQALEKQLSISLTNPKKTEESKKEVAKLYQEIAASEEALKAIKIKSQIAVRNARIQEVQIELDQKKAKTFTVEQEIAQMRVAAAKENRNQLIQVETERLLAQRGLTSNSASESISIRKTAAIQANAVELNVFKNKLNAEKELAITVEKQKQLEVASLRANLLQGTSNGAQAGQDVEVIQQQKKMAQLNSLRAKDLISEKQYQSDLSSIKIAAKQKALAAEMALEQQRIADLGLSPEALGAKLDLQTQQDQMELDALTNKLNNKLLTEQEFKVASEQLEMKSAARSNQIRQQHLQQEIQQNKMKGDSWGTTLKTIELAQQQHGKVMGTLRAVQGSAEFGAIQGMLGNLSSLRNSSSRSEFEIGKKAAIAQASVAMFMGATQAFAALSSIPIVGPALGTAAAAAAIAAGMLNIKQIKSQKFSGGAASGSRSAPTAQVPTQSLGGQADQGMDAVPRSLHGKSFILAAGERIVQPEANKKLTNFLDNKDQKSSGHTFNIHIGSVDNEARVQEVAQAVKNIIREDSERGEIIISSRGVA